jgi:hypothetical protein
VGLVLIHLVAYILKYNHSMNLCGCSLGLISSSFLPPLDVDVEVVAVTVEVIVAVLASAPNPSLLPIDSSSGISASAPAGR